MSIPQSLIEKIEALPAERLEEVESFVDQIAERAQSSRHTNAAMRTSEPVFAKIWNNPDDDAYDAL
jgi:hypothetical protein